jgi:hypothetical protein
MSNQTKSNLAFSYYFSFASLIPPFSNYFIYANFKKHFSKKIDSKGLQFKYSYLLLTWLYFLITKNVETKKLLKLKYLPTKSNFYTLQKAPMAHKTNSQERFKFKFFFFQLKFKTLFFKNDFLDSYIKGLLFLLKTKTAFPNLETNLFFLKSYKIIFSLKTTQYLTYNP